MPDLDAMQLAEVGAALWECVQKNPDEQVPPDWDYIAGAVVEGATLDTVRNDVKNAVEMARGEWEDAASLPPSDGRWLGEVLVRELAYRGFKVVRAE